MSAIVQCIDTKDKVLNTLLEFKNTRRGRGIVFRKQKDGIQSLAKQLIARNRIKLRLCMVDLQNNATVKK
ncbi:MAG: hypothetical protein IPH89_12215 [Bacteroidetes bacterium]|nr:hypothetical protein [Bacteroidota bacterium]